MADAQGTPSVVPRDRTPAAGPSNGRAPVAGSENHETSWLTDAVSWLGGHKLVVFLLAAAVAATVAALSVGFSLNPTNPHRLRLELAKALGTLATGLWLGGLLKLAMDNHADSKKTREEHQKQFDAVVADLNAIHDNVETAQLFIAAHRSAKTYGEQLRGLVAAHVLLMELVRTPGLGVLQPSSSNQESLILILAYLKALQKEYEDNYKDVANLQRYDEEVTKRTMVKDAEHELETGDKNRDPHEASGRAWMKLKDPKCFPVLTDFRCCRDQFTDAFLNSCHALSCSLNAAKRDGKLTILPPPGPPWLDEGDVRKCVEKNAKRIHDACEAAAASSKRNPADRRPPR